MASCDVLLNRYKDTLYVEIHDLGECILGMFVERCSPCCTRVGEEDVDMVGMLADSSNQLLAVTRFGEICWNRNGFSRETWKLIQGLACLLTRLGFAGGDEDQRAAGLSKT